MSCEHGLQVETCPHCRMHIGVKPPIQLVKPAAREIPMPVPSKDGIHIPLDLQHSEVYQPSKVLSHMPQRLTRNLDVNMSMSSSTPSLFQERSQQLHAKHNPKGIHQDPNSELSIIDLRRKFTQK